MWAYSTLGCLLVLVGLTRIQSYGQELPVPPAAPKFDAVRLHYWGEVVVLTKTVIAIQFPNPNIPPKQFELSADLAAGKVPSTPRQLPGRPQPYTVTPSHMYRITDVKVGDLIVIHYSQLSGKTICDHICIQKRPGGRVPPLPEEAEALRRPPPAPPGITPPLYIPYHERMNARWDELERRGAPHHPVAPPPREVNRPQPQPAAP